MRRLNAAGQPFMDRGEVPLNLVTLPLRFKLHTPVSLIPNPTRHLELPADRTRGRPEPNPLNPPGKSNAHSNDAHAVKVVR